MTRIVCLSVFLSLCLGCATATAADPKVTPVGPPIVITAGPPPPVLWIDQPMSDGSSRLQRAPRYESMPCPAWQAELDRLQRQYGEPTASTIGLYWRRDVCGLAGGKP